MKLHCSQGSPFARKVRIVLIEKGLAFETDMAPRLRQPGELPGPGMAVPVLEDGNLALWESDVIVDYLLQTYPTIATAAEPPLAPFVAGPDRPWQDRLILATLANYGNTAVNLFFMKRDGVTPENSDYMVRQRARIDQCLDWLETQATPEGFMPGYFSVMDIAFICNATYAETRPYLPWRGRPSLEALYERHQHRQSVVATPIGPRPAPLRRYAMIRTPIEPETF
jgi:glutathione S-transferase